MRANGTPITGNDPLDTSTQVGPDFQKGWIEHLQSAFGGAAGGGVKFYALDNEVMLWNSTHRDVHPLPTTYDETWTKALSYGAAIKQQDPAAKVTGPVTWGYCDLFGSAADNCLDGADRQAHGGVPFVAWYLQQVCANPLAGGAHVVDYLDLHYYPQGSNVALNDDDSAATAARRLRSLKELYDPGWVSESWIADLGDTDANHYSKPNLIPRVRAWIDQYCPGTKLAITEYNWGNDGTAQRRGRAGGAVRHLRARGRRHGDALGRARREQQGRARVHPVPGLRRGGCESAGQQRRRDQRESSTSSARTRSRPAHARWCC